MVQPSILSLCSTCEASVILGNSNPIQSQTQTGIHYRILRRTEDICSTSILYLTFYLDRFDLKRHSIDFFDDLDIVLRRCKSSVLNSAADGGGIKG